jgi:hypothetical protein
LVHGAAAGTPLLRLERLKFGGPSVEGTLFKSHPIPMGYPIYSSETSQNRLV